MVELIVDNKQAEEISSDTFYVTPESLSKMNLVTPNSFQKATIRNCPVTFLTPLSLQNIYMALKRGSSATIYIHQPVLVMQEYDARTLEANAELAGFKDIKSGTATVYCEDLGTKIETLTYTLTK